MSLMPSIETTPAALSISGLSVSYDRSRNGRRVLDAVDLEIPKSSVLGLVGESGSGKSTLARSVAGLVKRQAGDIRVAGHPVPLRRRFPRALRRNVQMVFQDPYSSLDPTWPVVRSVAEPLALVPHSGSRQDRHRRALDVLAMVGIDPSAADRKPHAFSGGQRQRIAIARAIALEPELLICDEPVSALDVSTQNQILGLLRDLRDRLGVSILFISHDLAVIRQISTHVAVMYLGKVVESGPVEPVLRHPLHPYAQLLRDAVPRIGTKTRAESPGGRAGQVAEAQDRRLGCVFVDRCPIAIQKCAVQSPALELHGPDHAAACHLAREIGPTTDQGDADVVRQR